jgi:putative ABC transport system substrate-binding protein
MRAGWVLIRQTASIVLDSHPEWEWSGWHWEILMQPRAAALSVILALGILPTPLLAEAQQRRTTPRLGVVAPAGSPSSSSPEIDAFREALRDLGYIEGQNLIVEYRWTEGESDRCLPLIAELAQLNVDALVTGATPCALAAKKVTTSIPVVIGAMGDPVGKGIVTSLARPGGNITGLSLTAGEGFSGKWLELLREAVPRLTRVAYLRDPTNPGTRSQVKWLQSASQRLGLRLQPIEMRPTHLDRIFAAMTRDRVGGLVVSDDPLTLTHRTWIVALAAQHRLPAVYGLRGFIDAGGLMAYSASLNDLWRRAATYVDKILKGAKPADLPVEQPTKFELVINLKTAKALGLTIPQSLLSRADEVIE